MLSPKFRDRQVHFSARRPELSVFIVITFDAAAAALYFLIGQVNKKSL